VTEQAGEPRTVAVVVEPRERRREPR
jgi:hypothetical protein